MPENLLLIDTFLDGLSRSHEKAFELSEDFLADIVQMLIEVRLEENSGSAAGRDQRKAISAQFDKALANNSLDGPALMLLGKILSDAGWSVPARLQSRIVEKIQEAGPPLDEDGYEDLRTALIDIVEASDNDPFETYDALSGILAAFPPHNAALMLSTLAQSRAPVLQHTLVGFVMHKEIELAKAAIKTLQYYARGTPVESRLVERLVRIRPWLRADRQILLDETIRALRGNVLPPVKEPDPQSVKAFIMICDGSGSGGVITSLKTSQGWAFVGALTKAHGIEDAICTENMSKRETDISIRAMSEQIATVKTNLAGVSRYLELALWENLTSNRPPPFRLLAVLEILGLGPLAPRPASPLDIVSYVLGDSPEDMPRAHDIALSFAESQPWFEAGEEVEQIMTANRGTKIRSKAVLKTYLPRRRLFWARILALTAFVLNMDTKTHGKTAQALAHVAHELATTEGSVEHIPLMMYVANTTVAVYESA